MIQFIHVEYFLSALIVTLIACFIGKILTPKQKHSLGNDRSTAVSPVDIAILQRVVELLSNENMWEKNDDRICILQGKMSLFCAIAAASVELTGQYAHWGNPVRVVRKMIMTSYPKRWHIHPIMDFNNHPETKFGDVRKILEMSLESLR